MKTPDWIKPGAMCRTRDGRKVRIYAVDGYYRPVHGAVLEGKDTWSTCQWFGDGNLFMLEQNNLDLIGPWVEKPIVDWSKMPAWAETVAYDPPADCWRWFDHTPTELKDGWRSNGLSGRIPPEYTPTFTGNWQDSLVERPKA